MARGSRRVCRVYTLTNLVRGGGPDVQPRHRALRRKAAADHCGLTTPRALNRLGLSFETSTRGSAHKASSGHAPFSVPLSDRRLPVQVSIPCSDGCVMSSCRTPHIAYTA